MLVSILYGVLYCRLMASITGFILQTYGFYKGFKGFYGVDSWVV